MIQTSEDPGYMKAYDFVKRFIANYSKDKALEVFNINHSNLNTILEKTYWTVDETTRNFVIS